MPEPKYHFIFPSTSTRADKENGHWKSKDWTWIRNESGVLRLSEDAELGTVIRYIVGENKNDDNVVRIVPSKEGPIIPGSFEMTIPVKFSENYLPKKGPGNRWVNFLSVFDQTPNFAPDYSLIASINDEQGELAVVSKDYYGDPYKMGRAGYRLEPETWHMLTVRSISETKMLELYHNSKLVATCNNPPYSKSAVNMWHGGAYGHPIPENADAWIENGPVEMKVWEEG